MMILGMKRGLGIVLICILGLSGYYFWPEDPFPAGMTVTLLVVEKSKREMHAYAGDKLLKTYPISLGFQPHGDKEVEGDGKTPEGRYTINDKTQTAATF